MSCKRLNPEAAKAPDRGKKHVTNANDKASNPPRVVNGASSSGTQRYVSVVPPPAAAPSAPRTHLFPH